MTAETDLLPLPEPKGDVAEGGLDWTDEEMQDYARANLAELQREVEGLRVQIRETAMQRDAYKREVDRQVSARVSAGERAERLAGALREAREYVVSELAGERAKFAGYEHCSTIASIEADLAKIDAAIDHARGIVPEASKEKKA